MKTLENYIENKSSIVIERKNGVLTVRKNRFDSTGYVVTSEQAMELMDKYEGVVITNFEFYPEVSDRNIFIKLSVKNGTYGELYIGKQIMLDGRPHKVVTWSTEKRIDGNTTLTLVRVNFEFKQEYTCEWVGE